MSIKLVLTTLQVGTGDLVPDFVEVEQCGLESRVGATGSLQCFLDEGTERKTLLFLGTFR